MPFRGVHAPAALCHSDCNGTRPLPSQEFLGSSPREEVRSSFAGATKVLKRAGVILDDLFEERRT